MAPAALPFLNARGNFAVHLGGEALERKLGFRIDTRR
jgi:hypothetical protein